LWLWQVDDISQRLAWWEIKVKRHCNKGFLQN
jgi:hypothetical protein